MKGRGRGANKFVPDIIYFSKVTNIFDIENKWRIRIKENGPTPKVAIA
ncbi:hypothetical protein OOZ15_08920 [Galbibacter sp. EGI 63066]|nr:hypothetical protein [Galbibacter sp. EGI 63066]MCX2680057.1 hypothetical protein [Galbibacter sp. EGI 63066]